MSTADAIRLIAHAANPLCNISLLDRTFLLIARGTGTLETDVAPGLYKVLFELGTELREHDVHAKRGETPLRVEEPDELLSESNVPLARTCTTHESHESAVAATLSTPLDLGGDSGILVFIRVVGDGTVPSIDEGLRIHDGDGRAVADLATEGRRGGFEPQSDAWLGCAVNLRAGAYTLQAGDGATAVACPLPTSPRWRTHFYARVDRTLGTLDLSQGSILMLPLDEPFQPDHPDLRLTEIARTLLSSAPSSSRGTAIAQSIDPGAAGQQSPLTEMMQAKRDRILGIFAAHLMLQAREPDWSRIASVVRQVRAELGAHPDVVALEWRIALADAGAPPDPVETPPVLRASWYALVEATGRWPEAVGGGTLAAAIGAHVTGNGPVLTWRASSLVSTPPPPLGGSLTDLLLELVRRFPKRSELEAASRRLATEHSLDAVEAALLRDVMSYALQSDWREVGTRLGRMLIAGRERVLAALKGTGLRFVADLIESRAPRAKRYLIDLSGPALVRRYGVPLSNIMNAASRLATKFADAIASTSDLRTLPPPDTASQTTPRRVVPV